MNLSTARVIGLTAALTIAQVSVVGGLEFRGVHPDILLLLPVVAGISGGSQRAAILGFSVGLVADLFNETPFGLTALTLAIVGYACGVINGKLLTAPWWLAIAFAFCGSVAGTLLWVTMASVIGARDLFTSDLITVLFVVSGTNALLAPPILRLYRWAYAPTEVRALG